MRQRLGNWPSTQSPPLAQPHPQCPPSLAAAWSSLFIKVDSALGSYAVTPVSVSWSQTRLPLPSVSRMHFFLATHLHADKTSGMQEEAAPAEGTQGVSQYKDRPGHRGRGYPVLGSGYPLPPLPLSLHYHIPYRKSQQ